MMVAAISGSQLECGKDLALAAAGLSWAGHRITAVHPEYLPPIKSGRRQLQ